MTPKCTELQFLSLPTPNDTKNILMSQLWVDTLQHFPLWFVQHLKSDSTDVQWYRRLQTENVQGEKLLNGPEMLFLAHVEVHRNQTTFHFTFSCLFLHKWPASFSPWTGLLSDATSTAMGFFLAAGFFTKRLNCLLKQSVVTLFIIIQHPLVLICTKGGPKTFCLRQICLGGNFSKITSDRLHIRFPFGQIYSISISGLWSSSQSQTHFVLPADKADVFLQTNLVCRSLWESVDWKHATSVSSPFRTPEWTSRTSASECFVLCNIWVAFLFLVPFVSH